MKKTLSLLSCFILLCGIIPVFSVPVNAYNCDFRLNTKSYDAENHRLTVALTVSNCAELWSFDGNITYPSETVLLQKADLGEHAEALNNGFPYSQILFDCNTTRGEEKEGSFVGMNIANDPEYFEDFPVDFEIAYFVFDVLDETAYNAEIDMNIEVTTENGTWVQKSPFNVSFSDPDPITPDPADPISIDHPYTSITLDEAKPFEVLLTKKDGTKETGSVCYGVVKSPYGEDSLPEMSFYIETAFGKIPISYDEEQNRVFLGSLKSNAAPYWMRLYHTTISDFDCINNLYVHNEDRGEPFPPYNGTITEENLDGLLLIAVYTSGRGRFDKGYSIEEEKAPGIYDYYYNISLKTMQERMELVYGINTVDLSGSSVYDVKTQRMKEGTDKIIGNYMKVSGMKKNGGYCFEAFEIDYENVDETLDWGNVEAIQAAFNKTPFATVTYDGAAHITEIYYETAPSQNEKKSFSPGDVDGDGKITSADARLALRTSVGLESDIKVGSEAYKAANVDDDDKVTSADARLILRASVGLEDVTKWKK